MSYQTGTALNIDDMLGKLSVFAQANGWTENKIVAGSGNGSSSELYLSKNGGFFQFDAYFNGGNNTYHGVNFAIDEHSLRMYGSTSFDGGQSITNQPQQSGYCQTNWILPNMTAYHFFTDPALAYIHVVIETTANEFRHFSFGQWDKLGAFTGGEYVIGTNWNQGTSVIDFPSNFQNQKSFSGDGNSTTSAGRFHINVDGVRWKRNSGATIFESIYPLAQDRGSGAPWDTLVVGANAALKASPQTYNSVSPLHSIPVGLYNRSATIWIPVGHYYDARIINIKNIAPSTTLNIGGDEWLVFPQCEKKDPGLQDNLPNSGYYGYAYKKIP